MLTGPRGLFLIAGQEKVVTVDLERVLTAPPVEHLTVHRKAILVALGVIALTAYACCRLAGEADRMEGYRR